MKYLYHFSVTRMVIWAITCRGDGANVHSYCSWARFQQKISQHYLYFLKHRTSFANAATMVINSYRMSDFSPLKLKRNWKQMKSNLLRYCKNLTRRSFLFSPQIWICSHTLGTVLWCRKDWKYRWNFTSSHDVRLSAINLYPFHSSCASVCSLMAD